MTGASVRPGGMNKYSWCPVGVLNAVFHSPLPKSNQMVGFAWLSAVGQYLRGSEAVGNSSSPLCHLVLCIISSLDQNRDREIQEVVILMVKE